MLCTILYTEGQITNKNLERICEKSHKFHLGNFKILGSFQKCQKSPKNLIEVPKNPENLREF